MKGSSYPSTKEMTNYIFKEIQKRKKMSMTDIIDSCCVNYGFARRGTAKSTMKRKIISCALSIEKDGKTEFVKGLFECQEEYVSVQEISTSILEEVSRSCGYGHDGAELPRKKEEKFFSDVYEMMTPKNITIDLD
ncbi:MAG: hypothetical protein V1818_01850 [Candidatus Aenigmatarchaeota archaeon]